MYGPTGCLQGTQGGWCWGGSPVLNYNPGDFSDRLIESFAGTHDLLGGQMWGWYDEKGNTAKKNSFQDTVSDITTGFATPATAPFAMADIISPDFVELLINLRIH